MNHKQLISSKLAIVALCALLFFLSVIKFKQFQAQAGINKLKNNLLQQQSLGQKKNHDLQDTLNYLNSDNFKDQVARQQLNLQKQGELVYNFTESSATATAQAVGFGEQSDPKLWWQFFFGKNP